MDDSRRRNEESSTFLEILILGSNLLYFMCCRPILSLHRLNVLDRRNPMFSEGQSLRHKILFLDLRLHFVRYICNCKMYVC